MYSCIFYIILLANGKRQWLSLLRQGAGVKSLQSVEGRFSQGRFSRYRLRYALWPYPDIRSRQFVLSLPVFLFVVHRSQYFDPVIKIAGHPVGRTNIIFFFSAIGKDKDTGVFKISVDNTVDMDIFTDTCDACHQRTVAAYYQFHLNSGCRGFVEFSISARSVIWFTLPEYRLLSLVPCSLFPC